MVAERWKMVAVGQEITAFGQENCNIWTIEMMWNHPLSIENDIASNVTNWNHYYQPCSVAKQGVSRLSFCLFVPPLTAKPCFNIIITLLYGQGQMSRSNFWHAISGTWLITAITLNLWQRRVIASLSCLFVCRTCGRSAFNIVYLDCCMLSVQCNVICVSL